LRVLEEDNVRAVVKDYSVNGFLFRNIVGRFLVWRECKAYRRLRDLEGVPVFYGSVGGLAVVFEELPGRNVEGLEHERKLPEQFFKDLRALIERIHERGLAHCDLKRAPNTIIGPDGKPYIVDWSAAIARREFRFFPFTLIYRRFIQDDFNAVIKLQLRHCPEAIDPEEKKRYFHRGPVERAIRSIRDRARDILQKVA
jgi:RIO-like serine/threonine protein kinase